MLSGIMLKDGNFWSHQMVIANCTNGVRTVGADSAMLLSSWWCGVCLCIAIVQKDFKRLIAYSSIAHVGLISAEYYHLTNKAYKAR
ncbi:MAG: hypothetical protein IPM51_15460 [Sphingobacteriaceae bacterium]|nr:hypothetical protein [Sphingobacteriaceae bacterium]